MESLRRDAVRNREKILDAARALAAEHESLQLNAVARRAEVGVGTVYRHFATPEALTEALVHHRFLDLAESARTASADAEGDPVGALRAFLSAALAVYADDADFAAAVTASAPTLEETRSGRAELMDAFEVLVRRAAESLRPGWQATDLMILLCGLGYAARLNPSASERYLDALMDGVVDRRP